VVPPGDEEVVGVPDVGAELGGVLDLEELVVGLEEVVVGLTELEDPAAAPGRH
jgi:hypothetical protein